MAANPSRKKPFLLAGRYRVTTLLGAGRFAEVYRADDRKLGKCAIKLLRREFVTGDSVQRERLQREARALAELTQHPAIVSVFDVQTDGDDAWIVMECIDGSSLEGCGPLDVIEAAQIVRTLADALAAAHARGIVHRDVKPANILRATDGSIRLADFGIAALALPGPTLTLAGTLLGTPSFMAPEQATGVATPPNAAIDIYSAGATLYALLTGRPPFPVGDDDSVEATINEVIHADVTSPRTLRPDIPSDLEAICLSCLARKPAERPRSAGELAELLDAFLAGRPVRIPRRRSLKWMAASSAGIAASIAGSVWWLLHDHDDRIIDWSFRDAIPGETSVIAWSAETGSMVCGTADGQLYWLDDRLRVTRVVPAHGSGVTCLRWDPEGTQLASGGFDGTVRVHRTDGERGLNATLNGQRVTAVAFSPDGSQVAASAENSSQVTLFRVADGSAAGGVSLGNTNVWKFDWSARNVLAIAGSDRQLRFLTPDGQEVHAALKPSTALLSVVCWNPVGDSLALADREGQFWLWDAVDGRLTELSRESQLPIHHVAWSPDGRWFVSLDPQQITLHAADGTVVDSRPQPARATAWSRTSASFATCGERVRLWNRDGTPGLVSAEPRIHVSTLAGAISNVLAVAAENSVWFWQLDGSSARLIRTQRDTVHGLAWSADFSRLAVTDRTPTVTLCNDHGAVLAEIRDLPDVVRSVAWNRDGSRLAVDCVDGTVHLFDQEGTRQQRYEREHRISGSLAWSPDGEWLALLDIDRNARPFSRQFVRTLDAGFQPGPVFPEPFEVYSFDWSPDSTHIVIAGPYGRMALWLADGASYRFLSLPPDTPRHTADIRMVRFSPDGARIVSVDRDGGICVWDATGALLAQPEPLAAGCDVLAWCPDSSRFVTGTRNGLLVQFDRDGGQHSSLPGHRHAIGQMGWSADGRTLAVLDASGMLTIHDGDAGQPVARLVHFPHDRTASFALSGQLLSGDPLVVAEYLSVVVETSADRSVPLTWPEFSRSVRRQP